MRFYEVMEGINLFEANVANMNAPINVHYKNEKGKMVSMPFCNIFSNELKEYIVKITL